jgi:hypothetical protein
MKVVTTRGFTWLLLYRLRVPGRERSEGHAAWRRAIELSLGDEDTAKLRSIAHSRTEPAGRVGRARILLAHPEDPSFFAVSRALGLRWARRDRGLDGCARRSPASRPGADDHARGQGFAGFVGLSKGEGSWLSPRAVDNPASRPPRPRARRRGGTCVPCQFAAFDRCYYAVAWATSRFRTIRGRILFAFLITSMITSVLGAYATMNIQRSGVLVEKTFDQSLMSINYARAAATDFAAMRAASKQSREPAPRPQLQSTKNTILKQDPQLHLPPAEAKLRP